MKRSAAIFLRGSAAIGGIAALISCINEHARPEGDGDKAMGEGGGFFGGAQAAFRAAQRGQGGAAGSGLA